MINVYSNSNNLYIHTAQVEHWWMDTAPIWVAILPCKSMVMGREVTHVNESVLSSSSTHTTPSYAHPNEYGQMCLSRWGVCLERWDMKIHYNHTYFSAQWKQKTFTYDEIYQLHLYCLAWALEVSLHSSQKTAKLNKFYVKFLEGN